MASEQPKTGTVKGPIPPSFQMLDFLSTADHRSILDWVLANRDRFKPATVTGGEVNRVDDRIRVALKLRDLGPVEDRLREQLLTVLPQIVAAIGGRLPPQPSLELELTAYGDGAFYAPHEDFMQSRVDKTAGAEEHDNRLLSAVYYFHCKPQGFAGGELRLYRWGANVKEPVAGDWHDIDPVDNSLVAFPSWATHEVRPVGNKSGVWDDFRFALNCWYCAPLPSRRSTGD